MVQVCCMTAIAAELAHPTLSPTYRYASDATVAIFVAILLFIVPSQKPKFNFCSQTKEGKAPVLAFHSSGLGPWPAKFLCGSPWAQEGENRTLRKRTGEVTKYGQREFFKPSLGIV